MVHYPSLDRERTERLRKFWRIRSAVFAVLEVALATALLILGVIFRLPILAFAMTIAGTIALIALYRMLPSPSDD